MPAPGQQLGHVLLLAELRGLICSAPTAGQHAYALLDEVVPPTPPRERADAIRELVHRFFRGHGPASVKDFTRWSSLPATDTVAALADLDSTLESVDVDGESQWYDPAAATRTTAPRRAYLLPVYDEVALTYPRLGFPPLPGHPHAGATNPWQQDQFSGGIVADERNLGTWKRTTSRSEVVVRTALAPDADPDQRELVHAAAQRLADIHQLPLDHRPE